MFCGAYFTAICSAELVKPRLGSGIGDVVAPEVAHTRQGRDVDDGTGTLLDHQRKHVLAGQEDTGEVKRNLGIPDCFIHGNGITRGRTTNIVVENVDPTEPFPTGIDHRLHRPGISHISSDNRALTALAFDQCAGFLGRISMDVGGQNARTFARKQNCSGLAIAPSRARWNQHP